MKLSAAAIVHADNMAARSTFKISDEVRDVLARSTITATSVKLPDGQLERKLYEQVNKALAGSGGRWDRKSGTHLFDRDPREALGMAVETGKATNVRTKLQAFYTPPTLAARVVDAANLESGARVLEPSIGDGALARAICDALGNDCEIVGYDIDDVAIGKARASLNGKAIVSNYDFLAVECTPGGAQAGSNIRPVDAVVMNPPFTGGADMAHVTHAWGFVKPGGTLVAIMSPGWRTAKTKAAIEFRKLIATAVVSDVEDIDAGTFEHTDIATVMLTLRKPA